jgi:hypothetical protein
MPSCFPFKTRSNPRSLLSTAGLYFAVTLSCGHCGLQHAVFTAVNSVVRFNSTLEAVNSDASQGLSDIIQPVIIQPVIIQPVSVSGVSAVRISMEASESQSRKEPPVTAVRISMEASESQSRKKSQSRTESVETFEGHLDDFGRKQGHATETWPNGTLLEFDYVDHVRQGKAVKTCATTGNVELAPKCGNH